MALLLIGVGLFQSWNVSLSILNLCLISAIMALGVNIQWGYAGLFNVGIMGFAALGGLAAVLVAMPPVEGAWSAGGWGAIGGLFLAFISITLAVITYQRMSAGRTRSILIIAICVIGFFITRSVFGPATHAIEDINPAKSGYLGGFGLPIVYHGPLVVFSQVLLHG